jgi:hypothetical protein
MSAVRGADTLIIAQAGLGRNQRFFGLRFGGDPVATRNETSSLAAKVRLSYLFGFLREFGGRCRD